MRAGIDIQAGFNADVNMAMAKGDAGRPCVTSQTQMVDQRGTNVQNVVSNHAVRPTWGPRAISGRSWLLPPVRPIVGTVDVGGNQAGSQRTFVNYGYGNAGTNLNSNVTAGGATTQARNQLDGVNTTEGTSVGRDVL